MPKLPTEASGPVEVTSYDGWGQVDTVRDFNGRTVKFTHDDLGRVRARESVDHPTRVLPWAAARIEHDLDAEGRVTASRVRNAAGAVLHEDVTPRDERGRVRSKTSRFGGSFASPTDEVLDYTWTDNDHLETLSGGGAEAHRYVYDHANRLAEVWVRAPGALQETLAANYSFHKTGTLSGVTTANGLTSGYRYDALNRLRQMTVGTVSADGQSWTSVLQGYGYAVDRAGQRTRVDELGGRQVVYRYDRLHRLDRETRTGWGTSDGVLTYTLDKVGNRLKQESTLDAASNVASVLPVEAYTVNARDLLTDVDGRARSYDAAGNTLSVAALVGEPGSGTEDTYDFLNRLIERRRSDGAVFRLEYDADGNRVGKQRWSTGGGTLLEETTYLVETLNPTGYAQVLAERTWTPTSLRTRTYTLGLDLIAQTRTDSTTANVLHETFLYDGFGSVRGLTDDTGVQIATYTFDAWGRLLNPPATGELATHYLYRGEQWDEDLKLSYNRARYLDLDTGRFWTMDTYEGRNGEPLSLHKFLYANGNPVMGVDPSGMLTTATLSITAAEYGLLATMRAPTVMLAPRIATMVLLPQYSVALGYASYAPILGALSSSDLFQVGLSILKGEEKRRRRGCPIFLHSYTNDLGMKTIVEHIDDSISDGLPRLLHRMTGRNKEFDERWTDMVRAAVLPRESAGIGMSWDEYPFASTMESVRTSLTSVRSVPERENNVQGGKISSFYQVMNIEAGDCFIIWVTP